MKLRKIFHLALLIPLFSSSALAAPPPKTLNRFKDKIEIGNTMPPITVSQKEKERKGLVKRVDTLLSDHRELGITFPLSDVPPGLQGFCDEGKFKARLGNAKFAAFYRANRTLFAHYVEFERLRKRGKTYTFRKMVVKDAVGLALVTLKFYLGDKLFGRLSPANIGKLKSYLVEAQDALVYKGLEKIKQHLESPAKPSKTELREYKAALKTIEPDLASYSARTQELYRQTLALIAPPEETRKLPREIKLTNIEQARRTLIAELNTIKELLEKKGLFKGEAKRIWEGWEAEAKAAKDMAEMQELYKAYPFPKHIRDLYNILKAYHKFMEEADFAYYEKIDDLSSLYTSIRGYDGATPARIDAMIKFMDSIVHASTGKTKDEVLGEAKAAFSLRSDFIAALNGTQDPATLKSKLVLVASKCKSRFGSYAILESVIDTETLKRRFGITSTPLAGKSRETLDAEFDQLVLVVSPRQFMEQLKYAQLRLVDMEQFIQLSLGSDLEHLDELYGDGSQAMASAMQSDWETFVSKLTAFDLVLMGSAWKAIEQQGYASPQVANTFLKAMKGVYDVDSYLLPSYLIHIVPGYLEGTYSQESFAKALFYFSTVMRTASSKIAGVSTGTIRALPMDARRIFVKGFEDYGKKFKEAKLEYTYQEGLAGSEGVWRRPSDLHAYQNPLYYQMEENPFFRGALKRLPMFLYTSYATLSLEAPGFGIRDPYQALYADQTIVSSGAMSQHLYLSRDLVPPKDEFRVAVPKDYKIQVANPMAINTVTNEMFGVIFGEIGKIPLTGETISLKADEANYVRGGKGATTDQEHKGKLDWKTEEGGALGEVVYRDFHDRWQYRATAIGTRVPGKVPIVLDGNIHSFALDVSGAEESYDRQLVDMMKQLRKGSGTTMMVHFDRYHWDAQNRDKLMGYMYFLEPDGSVHKLAISEDELIKVMKFYFGETEMKHLLASVKGHKDVGMHGFALAGNIPIGKGMAAGSLGNFIRDWTTGDIKAMQYAGFLGAALARGQSLQFAFRMTPVKKPKPEGEGYAIPYWNIQGTYRKLPVSQADWALVLSGLGGKGSWGGKFQYESPQAGDTHLGVGLLGGAYKFAPGLLYQDAEAIKREISTHFVDVYGWVKDKADKWGILAAGMYLNSQVTRQYYEGFSADTSTYVEEPESEGHYGRGLLLGWFAKHHAALGFEKLPGWTRLQPLLDNMNQSLAENPQAAASILRSTSQQIEQAIKLEDLMRFSAGYGHADDVAIKAALDTYQKYGTLKGLAYVTDWLYLEILTSAWYRQPVDDEVMSFNLFGSVGWHRGLMKDVMIDGRIAAAEKRLLKVKEPAVRKALQAEIARLKSLKTRTWTDFKFTTGPTFEWNWTADDLSLSGWGFKALTRVLADPNEEVILGAMGTTPIELEGGTSLKQYQVVYSHQLREQILQGEEIKTWYVLLNYSDKKVQVFGSEGEYNRYAELYAKGGLELAELSIKSRTGRSVSFTLKAGAVKLETGDVDEWIPSVVGGFKFTQFLPEPLSLSLSGGYGPFGLNQFILQGGGRGMDVYRMYQVRQYPFNLVGGGPDPMKAGWGMFNITYEY